MPRAPVSPFLVQGKLAVQSSATVICLRQRLPSSSPDESDVRLGASEVFPNFDKMTADQKKKAFPVTLGLFGPNGEASYRFDSGWEILLGQSEVINWLKSTPEKLTTMRYAGEWKLPGGNVDEGEAIPDTAKRELEEEFLHPCGLTVPEDAVIRPFNVKQTRPIRSRSNIIHNFIAMESENEWLSTLDVSGINLELHNRRVEFKRLVSSGAIWDLNMSEREKVTPEVHSVEWVPLRDAIKHCLTSTVPNVFVNSYQETEYKRFGKTKRDPMIMTAAALFEIEKHSTVQSIIESCNGVSLDVLREKEQHLFPGMVNEDVINVMRQRDEQRRAGILSTSVMATPTELAEEKQINNERMAAKQSKL